MRIEFCFLSQKEIILSGPKGVDLGLIPRLVTINGNIALTLALRTDQID
jgi:hypothetical protein